MANVETAYPHEGGCWYCCTKDDDLVFCCEFDTYVHLECLEEALKDPDNREAQIMKRELMDDGRGTEDTSS